MDGPESMISDEKVTELRNAFNLFDRDRDGSITHAELKAMMKALGQDPTDADISDMISEVDMSGTRTVEFNEFLFMMAKRHRRPEEKDDVVLAFELVDKDKDGFLSPIEIRRMLKDLGEDVTDAELAEIMRDNDKDKDGKLSFDEFKAMMARQD